MTLWPKYCRERLWVGAEQGWIAMVTLWTAKERFLAALDQSLKAKIAAVGQLYTKRGIEFIFRNLWANPRIRYLVVTGADLSDTARFLLSPNPATWQVFLPEIPIETIERLFQKVKRLDWRDCSPVQVAQKLSQLIYQPPFAARPRFFPLNRPKKANRLPAENSVFRVETATIGEGWLKILALILKFGHLIPRLHLYGGKEKTLLNVAAVITAEKMTRPKIWPFFDFDRADLRRYFKSFFNPDRGDEAYTYGERLFGYEVAGQKLDQVSVLVRKLQSFPYNKGALITLWQPQIDNFPRRRPWRTPCLTLVQGFCFGSRFYLTASFRSQDIFGAWPQNAFALRQLQTKIAVKLKKQMGELTLLAHTAFIDQADLVLAQAKVAQVPLFLPHWDPRGNLLVRVEDQEIVVEHLSPEGKKLAEYRQDGREKNAAQRLARCLAQNEVLSQLDHALYLGQELGRAEAAIKLGADFHQL